MYIYIYTHINRYIYICLFIISLSLSLCPWGTQVLGAELLAEVPEGALARRDLQGPPHYNSAYMFLFSLI